MLEYLAYMGSWQSSEPVLIGVPTYGDEAMPYTEGTVAELTQQYPAVFNNIYTYFAGEQVSVATLNNLGFPRVLKLNAGDKIYFSETNYIECTSAIGGFALKTGNTVLARFSTVKNRAIAIPPYNPNRQDFSMNAVLNIFNFIPATGKLGAGRLSALIPSGTEGVNGVTQFFENLTPYVENTDPYAPAGTSGTGGGTGTFDLTSDIIGIPNLPTLSAVNAGLVTVYVPTINQLATFASLLFGRTFLDAFLNAVTTLFVDPLEAVIGLSIIPVSPSVGAARQVSVAFIGLNTLDGPLTMQPASSQYVEVDCGTIFVDEYSGSALDYAPYSKFHIYLPYIGTRDLSTDEIRNKNVHVVYHIDIVSGSCVALIEVEGSVLYQFAGNCATPIPINGRDFSHMVTAGIQLAAAFAGASAGAGVGAAAAGNIGKPDDYISTDSSFERLVKTLDSDEGIAPSAKKEAGGKVDAEHLISATAGVVAGMKPHIQHASGIGGSAGMLGVQKPYLIAEIPRQSLASEYNKFVGYPSNITSLLGDLTGFTQIEMIHLKGIPCTETELSEIDKMLRNGVIL